MAASMDRSGSLEPACHYTRPAPIRPPNPFPGHSERSIPGWTHSSVPSAQVSRFQIGTTSLSVSISQRQASNA